MVSASTVCAAASTGGETQRSSASLTKVLGVLTEPKLHCRLSSAEKPVPSTVTSVAPPTDPRAGAMDVAVSSRVKRSAALAEEEEE